MAINVNDLVRSHINAQGLTHGSIYLVTRYAPGNGLSRACPVVRSAVITMDKGEPAASVSGPEHEVGNADVVLSVLSPRDVRSEMKKQAAARRAEQAAIDAIAKGALRAAFERGVEWIAENDDAASSDALSVKVVSGYISTITLSVATGRSQNVIARAVVAHRKAHQ